MKFTPKRRVLASLLGGRSDRVPVTSVAGCGGTVTVDMQETVGIYWPEAHKDPEKMAKLAIESQKLTGIENTRVPFDFVVEPEALGCEIKWGEKPDSVPSVIKHPYKDPEKLKKPKELLDAGRIPIVLEAIRLVRREVGDTLPISSLVLGPFTLAGELAGLNEFLMWTVKKPEYVEEFVKFATEIAIEFAKAQYRAGSDIVMVGSPTASLIGPNMFRKFVKPYLTKIAEELGGIRVLHVCGNTEKILNDMAETGFDALSIETKDVTSAKSLVGEVKILGSVSSSNTLTFGSPEEVKVEAKRYLEGGVDLLEPNCGFSPITPLENVKAMVKARDEFYT